jgi:hypothetical protein
MPTFFLQHRNFFSPFVSLLVKFGPLDVPKKPRGLKILSTKLVHNVFCHTSLHKNVPLFKGRRRFNVDFHIVNFHIVDFHIVDFHIVDFHIVNFHIVTVILPTISLSNYTM